ncbi:MAG TPA: cytochrome c biogenesis protein CcsA [Fimbriimonadaceae bacterium]|jgi:cytochrome c-type biogenesis protein CcmF
MNDFPELHLPIATPAQLFIGTLGRIFIWGGVSLFALTLIQSLFFPKSRKLGSVSFVLGCVCIFASFLTLGSLFLNNQYEFAYVYEHSQASDAAQYKVAAIWAGQEGSFLLWATTSAIFGMLTIWATGIYRRWFAAVYSLFLGSICGILAYESPFNIQLIHGHAYIPPTGQGLNASLQNYWVVIHPPTIFLGFGSLTVLFAYAVSALVLRKYQDWTKQVRPWALVSLSLVGVGLCMGGMWAYETLGWGGFWKWDPVENVSFVPWCMTVALVHGLIVQGVRGKWFWSNLMLAGLPFLFFTYGTFLTRAGFLDGVSVHSFATMEHTAHMVLLTLCIVATAGFFGLWGARWWKDSRSEPTLLAAGPIVKANQAAESSAGKLGTDREGWYRTGSLLIVLIGIASAIGMSVPLFQYMAHQQPKVVDEHLYHLVLSWFFIPVMLMMAVAPFVGWRKLSPWDIVGRVFNVLSITIGLLGVIMMVMNNPRIGIQLIPNQFIDFPFKRQVPALPWVVFLVGICLFTIVGNTWRLIEMRKAFKLSLGAFVAHVGVATAMSGLIISRGLERSQVYELQAGEISAPVANANEKGDLINGATLPFTMNLHEIDEDSIHKPGNHILVDIQGQNDHYIADPKYVLDPTSDGDEKPESVPDIHRYWTHDNYLSMGSRQKLAGDPQTISVGQTKSFRLPDFEDGVDVFYNVKYLGMQRVGQPGQSGTKLLANLEVETPNHAKLLVNPGMQIGSGPLPADIDADYFVSMERMDAATREVTLQMRFIKPVYLAYLYYKPMVILVWIGAGLMFLGGMMSALYRRKSGKPSDNKGASSEAPSKKNDPLEAVSSKQSGSKR